MRSKKLLVTARILFSMIFLLSAISKITDWSGMVGYIQSKGLPWPNFMLFGAVLVELLGSLALISGYKLRHGSLLLFLYLIPTSLIFHNFWAFEGMKMQQQMIHFFKNISLMGGLLAFSYLSGLTSTQKLTDEPATEH